MAMAVGSANDGSPMLRPRPPSKRYSRGPSPVHLKTGHEDASPRSRAAGAVAQAGVLGGLRERSQDELARAGREELVAALRAEWATSATVEEKYDRAKQEVRQLQAQQASLGKGLMAEQARTAAALSEQTRLEADVESRQEALEMYTTRAHELERQLKTAEKRRADQDSAFEAERQAFQDSEARLYDQIRALSASKAASPGKAKEVDQLQEELANLTVSQSALLAQVYGLTGELDRSKRENKELREENEAWEYLVRQQTLGGHFTDALTPQEAGGEGGDEHRDKAQGGAGLPKLDERDEDEEASEMDELHSELEAQTPILEDAAGFIVNLDVGPEVGMSALGIPRATSRRRTRPRKDTREGDVTYDLAAELDRAGQGGIETETTAALRAEVKGLKEANKALTLYCSKIIDRIIAQEGFEQILSVDYKTRKFASRQTPQRPSIQAVHAPMSATAQTPAYPAAAARSISDWTGGTPNVQVESSTPETDLQDRRVRRGFSLDLRNIGFGFGSPSPSSPRPQLRPLSLAGKRVAPGTPDVNARKLEPQEEDEEDRRERQRIEASMKLMGIDPASATATGSVSGGSGSAAANPSTVAAEPSRAYWMGRMWGRQSQSQSGGKAAAPFPSTPQPKARGGTPLARASSLLGPYRSPRLPSSPELRENASPRDAEMALREFDRREKEQAKLYSAGKAEGGYTTPSPGMPRRANSVRTASNRTILGDLREQETRSRKNSAVGFGGGKGHKGDESIDTLWSLGSDAFTPERSKDPGVPAEHEKRPE